MTTVTCLVVGDPHVKVSNIRGTTQMFESILELIIVRKPTFVVFLGDMLDTHERIHVVAQQLCNQYLGKIADLLPVGHLIILIGNHDRQNNQDFQSGIHPFVSLKRWSQRPVIVDTATVFTIEGLRFLGVPYVPPGRLMDAISTVLQPDELLQPGSIHCVFSHQEYRNAKLGVLLSTEGDVWDPRYPLNISGHIHDYDQLRENLIYTGTPMQHTFGERDDKAVVWLQFGTSNGDQIERIQLNLRKKVVFRLKIADVLAGFVPPTDKDVKIEISGTQSENKVASKLPSVRQWIKEGIKVEYRVIEIEVATGNTSLQGGVKHTRYADRLWTALSGNPELETVAMNLFGGRYVKTKTKLNIVGK